MKQLKESSGLLQDIKKQENFMFMKHSQPKNLL